MGLRVFVLIGVVFSAAARLFGTVFHPADLDSNSRITTAEIHAFWTSGVGALTDEEKRADRSWQQAEFLWRNGESYRTEAGFQEPYCSLPTSSGNWVSISNRYPRGLEIVEVLAAVSPSNFSGEFRIPGTAEWVSLDCKIEQDGRLRMIVPYIPSQWMSDSRRIEVRFELDAATYQGGEVLLQKIDRSEFNFESYYEQIIASIDRMAATQGIGLDDPVKVLRAGRVIDDPLTHHFATARFSAEFSRDVILILRDSGASGAAVYEINEEILHLVISDSNKDELERVAAGRSGSGETVRPLPNPGRAKDNPSLFFGCAPITNSGDLAFEAKIRCKLENEKSFMEQLVEFTGVADAEKYFNKVSEKVTEVGEKAQKKYITKADQGSRFAAGLPAFALNASYELYSYREEWQKQQLPKFVEKFDYEVKEDEIRNRGYLYEDSPVEGGKFKGTCRVSNLRVFAHVKGQGFDSAKFLRDKIPSAADAIPPKLKDLPLLGKVITKLVESGQKSALDTAESALRSDLMIPPCRWPDKTSKKGIQLEDPKSQFRLRTVAGSAIKKDGDESEEAIPTFSAAKVGKGPLRVSLFTDKEKSGLCLEPYSGYFSFEVRPIRPEFDLSAYSIQDVDEMLTMDVSLEDSYETDKLEWDFRDKNGFYLPNLFEEDPKQTLGLPHETTSSTKVHTLRINPPDNLDLYPLTVEALSLAEGCLRKGTAPDRRSIAKIHYRAKTFTIDPNRTCLKLGSSTELKAIPVDPQNTLDVEWEVTTENATITRTGPDTAVLMVDDQTTETEIEVKAKGNDTFEAFAYFSSGPCFERIGLTAFYPENFIMDPQVGNEYQNDDVMATLTFGAEGAFSQLQDIPPIPMNDPLSYNPGVEQVWGFGAVNTRVEKVEQVDVEKNLVAIDASYKGLFYTTFNLNRPGIFDQLYSEIPGGNYFGGTNSSDDNYFGAPLIPIKMVFSPEGDSVDVTFETDISPPGGKGSLSAAWTVLNGTKIDEETVDDISTMTARFTVFEFSPTVQLLVSGFVEVDGKMKSYSLQGTTQQRAIYLVGQSRIKVIQKPDEIAFCGGWIGSADPLGFILDDCCGFINLSDSSETDYIGIGRQNTSNAFLIDDEGINRSALSLTFKTDQSLPYCLEVERLKKETPNPEPYEEKEPVDPEPGETPEELRNLFKDSPNPGDDTQFLAVPPASILAGGGRSAAFAQSAEQFSYPFTNFLAQEGVKLGTFVKATGGRVSTKEIISQEILNYFGGVVRIVGAHQLSAATGSGYLIERNDPDTDVRLYDFWEIDPADDFLTARTLASDPTSDFSLLGSGDFDGDGAVDLIGSSDGEAFGSLLIRKGSADGFAAPVPFYQNTNTDFLRSAAVITDADQVLVSALDLGTSSLKIYRLDQAGTVLSSHTLAGVSSATTSLKAFTDANNDGVPDITLHTTTSPTFTIIYLLSDGTEQSRRNFDVPTFSTLPGPAF